LPDFVLRDVAWRDMASEIAAWDALALCATEPNPFYESWYLLPALRAFDPRGQVRLLRFGAGGDLAGILPIVRQRRYYRWPIPNLAGWMHGNCFLGAPLVAAGLEREFWQALLDWADRHAGIGLFLHLNGIPLNGPLRDSLAEVLDRQQRLAGIVHREERAMLASGETPESYFDAALSGKKRKELRRQFARLSELGDLSFARELSTERLEQWVDDFLRLEAAGWKGISGSALAATPETRRLFHEALGGAAARGRLERLSLALDGAPIAMLATFLTPPGAYSFKTAFDERYARFSPGVLLQRENLSILGRSGIAWSDSCAAADHPMIDHLWRERRAIGRLSIAIGGPARRALFGALLRKELGDRPGGLQP